MKGIERITDRIGADVQAEIDGVLGKAQAMGELPGFFKLVAAADGGRLLGAHIVGAHASDLVAEAALGVANGLTLEQVAHTIHAHPTLAEGLYEAALLAQEA